MNDELTRDFKGIWIPKDIWLDERLNTNDKIILMEIDSLDNGVDGCYASNHYLAEFCKCTETTVSTSISKLIKLDYLEVIKFDGRKRYLKSRLSKIERQTLKNLKADFKKFKDINIYNNIDNNNYNNNIKIYEFIEKNYGRTISPIEKEKVDYWLDKFGYELLKYAFEISVMNNKRVLNYVKAILDNWNSCGYKNKQDVINNQEKIKKDETNIEIDKNILDYDWFEEIGE